MLYWTEETLYWIAKPTIHLEIHDGRRRLHNETHAALESDIENLYFWHGVLVPAFVITNPGWITVKDILQEENAEVRRVMFERMGTERFATEAEMVIVHEDTLESNFPIIPETEEMGSGKRMVISYRKGKEIARLLRCDALKDFEDRPLMFVEVTCPSTGRVYHVRVKHDAKRAYEAVASTFGMTEKEYRTGGFNRQGDVCLLPLGKQKFKQSHS